jgi:hypothetical protein
VCGWGQVITKEHFHGEAIVGVITKERFNWGGAIVGVITKECFNRGSIVGVITKERFNAGPIVGVITRERFNAGPIVGIITKERFNGGPLNTTTRKPSQAAIFCRLLKEGWWVGVWGWGAGLTQSIAKQTKNLCRKCDASLQAQKLVIVTNSLM